MSISNNLFKASTGNVVSMLRSMTRLEFAAEAREIVAPARPLGGGSSVSVFKLFKFFPLVLVVIVFFAAIFSWTPDSSVVPAPAQAPAPVQAPAPAPAQAPVPVQAPAPAPVQIVVHVSTLIFKGDCVKNCSEEGRAHIRCGELPCSS